MPHDDHELALLELGIAEYTVVALSADGLDELHWARAYRLLRNISPRVDSVLMEIQKHVISLSLSETGEGSTGFSYVGSSSISNSVLSRGSTLSTRPSVEGRFSTARRVSPRFALWVEWCQGLSGSTYPWRRCVVLASDWWVQRRGYALMLWRGQERGGETAASRGQQAEDRWAKEREARAWRYTAGGNVGVGCHDRKRRGER
jgi:hypothetical protein